MSLFTPTADALLRAFLALGLSAPLVLIVMLMLAARSPLANGINASVRQPVQFDHRHHVADDGIDCLYCHDAVTKSATAGIPPTSRCMGCHAQIWPQSQKLAVVRNSFFEDRSIAWNKVHRLPDFVFFDHSVHVKGGVGCVTCHGRVDQMAVLEQVAPLSMQWCLDCHRDPAPHLRPLDQITSMTWEPSAAPVASVPSVHPRTECTTCHR